MIINFQPRNFDTSPFFKQRESSLVQSPIAATGKGILLITKLLNTNNYDSVS